MSHIIDVPGSHRRALSLLHDLTHIESPSLNKSASRRIAERIQAAFSPTRCNVTLVDTGAGTNIVAESPGTEPPLVLVGHTDTVWEVGTIDSALPWSHTDDTITGPGVFDMKSGIVVMQQALERLAHTSHRRVRIVLTCDEEIGSPSTQALLREASADAVGALGFESPHPDGALKVGRRGSTRVRLGVRGRSAHAALDPMSGVSAIDELLDQLVRLRGIVTSPTLPSEVLCNVGTIVGGTLTNVVPEHASADIGLRFITPETEQEVLAAFQNLSPFREGAELSVELLSHRPAWEAGAHDLDLLAAVGSIADALEQRIDGRPAAGAGDANLLASFGVPTIDGFGPRGGGAHALSEHVRVSSLFERIDLLTALLGSPARGA